MATILMYGVDRSLLLTRRLLLEGTGARVFTTTQFEDEIELMASQKPDVLILCQSLAMDQCQTALIMARELRPEMKTMVLVSEKTSHGLEVHNGVAVDYSGGLDALLTAVGKMIGQSDSTQPEA